MKNWLARTLLVFCALLFVIASAVMLKKAEAFFTHYFFFAWGGFFGAAESWLYLKSGDSALLNHPSNFFFFVLPLSAFIWFLFEAFNLRLENWSYVGVPEKLPARWLGYFFAFGTVLPGIFVTAEALDH